LKTQEGVLKEFERKYAHILKPQQGKDNKNETNQTGKTGGVLV
jgi:hypothetical protein